MIDIVLVLLSYRVSFLLNSRNKLLMNLWAYLTAHTGPSPFLSLLIILLFLMIPRMYVAGKVKAMIKRYPN